MLTIWYGFSSVLLGILLFFPVRKFILNLNINRIQSKNNREITTEELETLKKKVTVIAAVISVTFAFFYSKLILIKFFTPA
jgi:hypothetical protein